MAEKLVHYTCEKCGESLILSKDRLSAKCDFCGTEYYFKEDNSEALILALNRANKDRIRCDFYDAIKGYETILIDYPTNAEAHWGLVLSIFGMEYVKDYRTGQYVPTCHRVVEESILNHQNYILAKQNATQEQQAIFERNAKVIDKLQKAIKRKMEDEEEFEVFISFKSKDEQGLPTQDGVIGRKIRDELEARGIKTFFSDVTLQDRIGEEYEPIIYKALNTCKAFILVATSKENINAVWVKNEWTRFEERIEKEHLSNGTYFAVFENLKGNDLPDFLKAQQGFDIKQDPMGYYIRVADFISLKLGKSKKEDKSALLQKQLEELQAQQKAREEEQKRREEEQQQREAQLLAQQKQLEEMIKMFSSQQNPTQAQTPITKTEPLLKQEEVSLPKKQPIAIQSVKKEPTITQAQNTVDEILIFENAKNGYSVKGVKNKNVSSVKIPRLYNGLPVTSIGSSAFNNCGSLTSVTIGDSVTSIGRGAFRGCSGLTSVNYLGTIDQWVQIKFSNEYANPLYYAKKLHINGELVTSANINSATKINSYAFYYCDSLTNVTIGDSVTSIGSRAFKGCSGLTSVTIPNSVTSIGEYAFYSCSCSNLTSVNYLGTIDQWVQIKFSDEYANPLYYAKKLHINGELVTSANINSATKINSYAFYYCDSLTNVTIGNNVTSIGSHAFEGCKSLTSVTIPNSVTSIGYGAFVSCRTLTSVTIGNSVTSIGEYAFENCEILRSVTIPNSVTSIGYGAFKSCKSLTSVTIGNSVTSIGYSAFEGCKRLKSVTIPDSITSIGYYAFKGCSRLTSVTIGDSVTSIGRDAFYNCASLTSVTFKNPNGWYRTLSLFATSGISISSADLTNTSTAATYLKSTYAAYFWKRNV